MPMSVTEQREWFQSHTQSAVWCMTRPESTWGRTFFQEGALGRIATEDCEGMISRDVEAAGGQPASAYDALHVPNGDYSVQFTPARSGELSTYKFRIHLVQSGALAGQRIIKYNQDGGIYRGFGFITREGGFSLWQRFQRDVNAPYVTAAIYLIRALVSVNHENTSNTSINFQTLDQTMTWGDGERDLRISVQHRCTMCNNLVPEAQMRDTDPIALCRTHQHVTIAPEPEIVNEAAYDDNIRMPVVDESNILRCELGSGEIR